MLPSFRNFKLIIEYDGTVYHGWQRQKADITIQSTIEDTLNRMTGKRVTLIGSGRTDAGVHAKGQVANFLCDTSLTAETFQRGLNALLPDDIVINACNEVSPQFHSRYDALSKMYQYTILNRRIPKAIGRQYAWHISYPLNVNAMRAALMQLVGTHDFKSFEGSGSPRSHTVRDVMSADWADSPAGELIFSITANGFLKHMVRNIVGTLVDVGRGVISPEAVQAILVSGDRATAGATAPAHGLCLMHVGYADWP
jgi:tRNA pseudouridine38-40 synthase